MSLQVVILDNNGKQRGGAAKVPPTQSPEQFKARVQRTLAPGFVAVVVR